MTKNDKQPIVSLELTSGLSDGEKKRLSEFLAGKIAEFGKIRLLLFVKGYPARDTAEALFEDINFLRIHAGHIERMAVVGERAWQDTWVGIFGLFGRMETAYFDHSERERATNWLSE